MWQFIGGSLAGSFLGDRVSDLLTTRESTTGRAIEIVGSAPGDRTIPEPRNSISRGGDRLASDGLSMSDARWLAPLREAIAPRSLAGLLGSPPDAVTVPEGDAPIIPAVGSSPTASPTRLYPGSDPFSVLADIYSNLFGGDNPQAGTTQYSVVPQTVGGSGGNAGQIFLLLALAGVAVWWFYFRKKNAD